MASFYDQISANKRNSYILIVAVLALAFGAIYAFTFLLFGDDAGSLGLWLASILSIAYIAITYFFADRIMLSISGAREAQKGEFPYLVNTVEGVCIAAGLKTVPKIYIIDDPALNAFATGNSPEHASVAFTTGLLSAMNRAELEGVIAHELSHIKNYDSRLGTLVVVMIGFIVIVSNIGLRSMFFGGMRGGNRDRRGGGGIIYIVLALFVMILAPIAAQLIRLALSRQREYLADATGAELTRYPEGLASALEKIKNSTSVVAHATDATASLYFANPLKISGLFATHPPIDDRIKRLRAM